MKYTRKPKTVEAHQHDASVGYSKWPKWLQKAWDAGKEDPHAVGAVAPAPGDNQLKVNTSGGGLIIREGDYFIKEGELPIDGMRQFEFEKNFQEAKAPAKKAQKSTKDQSGLKE
jgi:hypothetical protein